MKLYQFHDWNINSGHAIAIQKKYSSKIITDGYPENVQRVAGIDLAFRDNIGIAAVVVLDFNTLEIIESVCACETVNYPYIPGLLSFREIPVIIKAFKKLQTIPDIIFTDGQGLIHPRRFGIACHLGLITQIPSIGCAKSLLCGTYTEVGEDKGDMCFVKHKGKRIGAALRSRSNIKEIFVSAGHKISLEKAVEFVMAVTTKYRIPEPARLADKFAAEYKKTMFPQCRTTQPVSNKLCDSHK